MSNRSSEVVPFLFDLESYISRYELHSETRLQRLAWIAKRAPTADVATLAYTFLERELKEIGNIIQYRAIFGHDGDDDDGSGGDCDFIMTDADAPSPRRDSSLPAHHPINYGFKFSSTYLAETEFTINDKLATLEANLNTAKANLNKQAIRIAYTNLAEQLKKMGNLSDALERLIRARDFATQTRQIADMCSDIVTCALDSRNYTLVTDNVSKAEHTPDLSTQAVFLSKMRIASGLSLIHEGSYRIAANKFLLIDKDLTNQFNAVISAEDIAVYGGLLGLATLSRTEITQQIESSVFRERLELVPPLRDAIRHFVLAEYGECLKLLHTMKNEWNLDIYLARHVNELWNMIRNKCIIQYLSPYASVSLQKMMEVFGCFDSLEEVECIVANLIKNKKIVGAKIDSVDKKLLCSGVGSLERKQRRLIMRKVGRVSCTLLSDLEGTMIRLSCLENGLLVKDQHDRRRARSWKDYDEGAVHEIESSDDDMFLDDEMQA